MKRLAQVAVFALSVTLVSAGVSGSAHAEANDQYVLVVSGASGSLA